jgi:uncharacterized membrane protein/sporulation protein YlmC with PRC-barrel domain
MVEIPVEASVECSDGPCGKSVTVIVNPATRKVTYLVVQDKSFLEPEQRMVPIEEVVETTSELIRLRCTRDQLSNMEPFVKVRFIEDQWDEPAYWAALDDIYYAGPYVTPSMPLYEQIERVPPGEVAVHRGAWVEATDGHIGTVGELVLDPDSEQITHFVLREGHLWGKKEVILPLSALDRVEEDTVYLKLDKAAVEQLPSLPLTRHYRKAKAAGANVELITNVFQEVGTASQALELVEDLHRRKVLRILDAAILVKEEDGTASVKDAKDLEPGKGRLLGAITGGLVGLLGGPVGAVVGALAGLGIGSLAAKWEDLGFSDHFLSGLQPHLKPGTSALVVLVEHEWALPLSEALVGLDGVILQQALTDNLVEALMQAGEIEG